MALNQKKSRAIAVDDTGYRWAFFQNSGWNDVTVQSARGTGQKMTISFEWYYKNDTQTLLSVTPAIVTQAIQFGLENGWVPSKNGKPYRCKFEDGQFLNR